MCVCIYTLCVCAYILFMCVWLYVFRITDYMKLKTDTFEETDLITQINEHEMKSELQIQQVKIYGLISPYSVASLFPPFFLHYCLISHFFLLLFSSLSSLYFSYFRLLLCLYWKRNVEIVIKETMNYKQKWMQKDAEAPWQNFLRFRKYALKSACPSRKGYSTKK